jgi:uncharacterized protein
MQEPVAREPRDLFQFARFLEQMRGAGNDLQAMFNRQLPGRLLIKIDDHSIFTAHDQQHGRLNLCQMARSQIRPAAARNHLLEQRARDGRIIDAHGDLRPQHICLLPAPVIIDCLEFNRQFRILDPVDELAYLALECERLGIPGIGDQVLAYYTTATGDACPAELIGFYKAFRACLRAKIAVWHTVDHDIQDHRRWLDLAGSYLALAEQYVRCW